VPRLLAAPVRLWTVELGDGRPGDQAKWSHVYSFLSHQWITFLLDWSESCVLQDKLQHGTSKVRTRLAATRVSRSIAMRLEKGNRDWTI
jgi:hypothetical protein